MPLFEYQCQNCGKMSEVLKLGGTPDPRKCPHCGAARLRRKLSLFGALRSSSSVKKCSPRSG
jgi:putative FmdB family regulatory protein